MEKIQPIILAGGNGSRLWPLSNKQKPKQFLELHDNKSSFVKSINLVSDRNLFEEPIIISNKNFEEIIQLELQKTSAKPSIIFEPIAKSTCPAIAIATYDAIKNHGKDKVLLILPSDHLINNTKLLIEKIIASYKIVAEENVIVFGISPTSAETAYGYIEKLNDNDVKQFIEKPSQKLAKKLIKNKNYFWNSGIFMFKAGFNLKLLENQVPTIVKHVSSAYKKSVKNGNITCLSKEDFDKCDSISYDHAILEKTDKIKICILPKDIGWNDIGAYNFLYEVSDKDNNGNSIKGSVFAENSQDCYFHSDSGKIVAIGLKNIVAVQKDGVTLIMDKSESQNVKNIFSKVNT